MSRSPEPQQTPGLKSRLAERLREALRTEILADRWSERLPGERELSREFQVSRPTLRLALWALQREGLLHIRKSQPCRIVRSTVVAVHTPARRPDVLVLHDGRMKPDPTTLILWTDHLRERLHELGLGLRAVDATTHGVKALPRTLAAIDETCSPSFYLLASLPPEAHGWFAARRLPAVIMGSRAPQIELPAMDEDHEATIRHAVHYLLRRGHRQLALLNLPPITIGSVEVAEIFLRCCAEAKSPAARGVVVHSTLRPGPVVNAVRRLMTTSSPPTAVIATDLELVVGLYTTLAELGRSIPRDVSVMSTEYWKIFDFFRPVPTCYDLSWENVANRVVRMIRNYQQLGVWPRRFWKLMPAFREGKSVATVRMSHQ